MSTKRYLNMPDTRPRDDWGNPIGNSYFDKSWSELTPLEQQADFEWKSDILSAYGEEVSCSTFYQDYLFRELYELNQEGLEEYKVALIVYDEDKGNRYNKVNVIEIEDYLDHDDVALSPCLYYKNWRRKNLLNYVCAFVLDIDRVRPKTLQRFLMLFDEQRLQTPTFIANSGSGIHFYYVLKEMLPVNKNENEANNLIAEEIYTKLYSDIINKEKYRFAQKHWLGQDYRVVGSKTKYNQTSQIFKVGRVYSIDELIDFYDIKIERKRYATRDMINYAKDISKNLNLEEPDYTSYENTYNFILFNREANYEFNQKKKAEKEKN